MKNTALFCVSILIHMNWETYAQSISASAFPDSTPLEHDKVTLKCLLDDYRTQFILLWKKNNVAITRNGQIIAEDLASRAYLNQTENTDNAMRTLSSDLVIARSNRDDTGSYFCEAWSVDSSGDPQTLVLSASLRLTIIYYPDGNYPTCSPDGEIRIRIGEQVSLSCLSEPGNPPVHLIWYKSTNNDFDIKEPLQADTFHKDNLMTSVMTLTSTLQDTNEEFTCELTGDASSVNETRSCSVLVKVIWPSPAIAVFVYPEQQVVLVNQSAEFSCHTAFPPGYDRPADKDINVEWITPDGINSAHLIQYDNHMTILNVGLEESNVTISCLVMFNERWFEATSVLYITSNASHQTNISNDINYYPWNVTFPSQPSPSSFTTTFSSLTSGSNSTSIPPMVTDKVIKQTFINYPYFWIPTVVAALLLLLLILMCFIFVYYIKRQNRSTIIMKESPVHQQRRMRQSESQTDLYYEDGHYMELEGRRTLRLDSYGSGASGPYTGLIDTSTTTSLPATPSENSPSSSGKANDGFDSADSKNGAVDGSTAAVQAFHSALKNLAELEYEYAEDAYGGSIKVRLGRRSSQRLPEPPNHTFPRRDLKQVSPKLYKKKDYQNNDIINENNNELKESYEEYYTYNGYSSDVKL